MNIDLAHEEEKRFKGLEKGREFGITPNQDHDHVCCSGKKSCGKCLRGLLCHGCNTKLGALENNDWRA